MGKEHKIPVGGVYGVYIMDKGDMEKNDWYK